MAQTLIPTNATPARIGRPPYLVPITAEQLHDFLDAEPAPTITEVAVSLRTHRQRLYEWAKNDPALADAMKCIQARHEVRTLQRLESKQADINAMFLLKAAHGYTDRPAPVNAGVTFKVEISRGVLTLEQKGPVDLEEDALEAEFSPVEG